MRTRSFALALPLLALWAQSAGAQQQSRGLYIGGGVGMSEYSDAAFLKSSCDALLQDCTSESSATGFKGFVGYQGSFIAVEAGYVNLGESSVANPLFGKIAVRTQGVTLSIMPTIPITQSVSIFGRGGVFGWYGEAEGSGVEFPDNPTGEGAGYSFFYGVGASVQIGKNARIRAEWERMNISEEVEVDGLAFDMDSDIDLFSASLALQFP